MKDRPFSAFWKLQPEEQDAVLQKLREAILWRGWDRLHDEHAQRNPSHANRAVQEIAKILSDAGHEQDEYT